MKKLICEECSNFLGLAGQAITYSICRVCGKDIYNGTTDVDVVCEECSNEFSLCSHCGEEIK